MDEIRVSFGALDAAQQSVSTSAQRIAQQLADLKTFVAPLVADWTGQASEQYQVRQQQVDRAWADINQVLGQIGVHLGQVNEQYQVTEAANVRRWT